MFVSDAGERRLSKKMLKIRRKIQEAAAKTAIKKTGKRPGKKRLNLALPGRVLVFESTGALLYGAIAVSGLASGLRLTHTAVSTIPDMAAAVADIVNQLKEKTKLLPKRAILISPSAAADLLHLPLNPHKPKADKQVGSMASFELEELFLQLADLYSMGALLMGRGAISAGKRYEVEGGDRRASGSSYGGLVADEHLDECLQLQEQLIDEEGELLTGSVPQGEDEDGQFAWWAVGCGSGLVERWYRAFKKNSIKLLWIYPSLGSAAGLVDKGTKNWLLVEVRQEQIGFCHGGESGIQASAMGNTDAGRIDPAAIAEMAKELLRPTIKTIYLAAENEHLVAIAEAMEKDGQCEIKPLIGLVPSGDSYLPPPVLVSMYGAASHHLKAGRPRLLPRINAQPPRPAIWKKKEIYPWLAIVALVVLVISIESWMRSKTEQLEWDLEMANIKYDQNLKLKKQAQQVNTEVAKLEAVLKKKQNAIKEIERQQNVIANVIQYRQEFVPAFLSAVAKAIIEEMMLDKIVENPERDGFYIEGWALRDSEAQRFVTRLNDTISPLGYQVQESTLGRSRGRLGLEGYLVKIWIVKTKEAEGSDA